MAKFYGSGGSFLSGRELKYFLASIVMVLLPLAIVLLLLLGGFVVASFFACLGALFFIVRGGFGIFAILHRRSMQFYKGRGGENQIRNVLNGLPEGYYIFQNIFLDSGKGNLDFVVVGPGGVVILEVKSIGGEINISEKGLTVNGQPMRGRNILRQAQGQMWALKKYLKKKTGMDGHIHSCLVFSHAHSYINPATRQVGGVVLVQGEYLPDFLESLPHKNIAPSVLEKILNALKGATN